MYRCRGCRSSTRPCRRRRLPACRWCRRPALRPNARRRAALTMVTGRQFTNCKRPPAQTVSKRFQPRGEDPPDNRHHPESPPWGGIRCPEVPLRGFTLAADVSRGRVFAIGKLADRPLPARNRAEEVQRHKGAPRSRRDAKTTLASPACACP